jgi:hypothetical protein
VFPRPKPVATKRCGRCQKPTKLVNLIKGYGPDCAEQLGLTGRPRDTEQTGTTLLDLLDEGDHLDEPGDHCDGWNR